MRPLLLAAFTASISLYSGLSVIPAAEPYAVYVSQEGAVVRCGPGESFYVTDRLSRASKLEVYGQEPDGWLAVRPPSGSFSWIPEGQIQLTEEPAVAEVQADNVAAWIGSRTQRVVQHHAQVRLERGELVEVLAERQFCPPDGLCQRWFKISPPSGEFRYIHSRFVSRRPVLESSDDPGDVPIEVAAYHAPTAARPRLLNRPSMAQPSNPLSPSQPGSTEAVRIPEMAIAASATEPAAHPQDTGGSEMDFLTRLERLQYELSVTVAQDVDQWNLEPLHKTAQALAETGHDAPQRGQARLLLEKIEKFQKWQQRFKAQEVIQTGLIEQQLVTVDQAGSDGPIGTGVQRAAHEQLIYDGSGWLMPVHSDKHNAPPYALVDKDGNILHFVSPAPGLNLGRYAEKEVGIIGEQGFVAEMQTPHLKALRVIQLDRHRR